MPVSSCGCRCAVKLYGDSGAGASVGFKVPVAVCLSDSTGYSDTGAGAGAVQTLRRFKCQCGCQFQGVSAYVDAVRLYQRFRCMSVPVPVLRWRCRKFFSLVCEKKLKNAYFTGDSGPSAGFQVRCRCGHTFPAMVPVPVPVLR